MQHSTAGIESFASEIAAGNAFFCLGRIKGYHRRDWRKNGRRVLKVHFSTKTVGNHTPILFAFYTLYSVADWLSLTQLVARCDHNVQYIGIVAMRDRNEPFRKTHKKIASPRLWNVSYRTRRVGELPPGNLTLPPVPRLRRPPRRPAARETVPRWR